MTLCPLGLSLVPADHSCVDGVVQRQSKNQSCFSYNSLRLNLLLRKYMIWVHVLTSHLGTYFCIKSFHPNCV